jgi:hypothetical protein
MSRFKSSLTRERFDLTTPHKKGEPKPKPVLALSNRMAFDLLSSKESILESFVVRAQSMHLCARMSGKIVQSFQQSGPLMSRPQPFKWVQAWEECLNDYERKFNEDHWVGVYFKGKPVFEAGKVHPFFNLIEKFDHSHNETYEEIIPIAEKAFVEKGSTVSISYDANTALVLDFEKKEGKCAVILRGAARTTTFNFRMSQMNNQPISYGQCLSLAASFLEGIQLAFMIGVNRYRIRSGEIVRFSEGEKRTKEGQRRLKTLASSISDLEEVYNIFYRPEKPVFRDIVADAEREAIKMSDTYI